MDLKDFFDSGIYVAVVAAAFVLVMLMLVLIGKMMGGSKKPSRRKKAAALVKSGVVLEELPALPLSNSNIVQPSIVPNVNSAVDSNDLGIGGMSSTSLSQESKPLEDNTPIPNLGIFSASGNESQPIEDSVPKPNVEIFSAADIKDGKVEQKDFKIGEDADNDVKVDDDGLDFFNIENMEDDTTLSEMAADLTDVDLDGLGELSREISQMVTGKHQ